ncbi:unnamed protein product [Linum tenue]|uniref:DYW domain-containing protein n=1 Tax=Linum tenue TaxID=586396 RepID=A0AAV0R2W9_9ROSI|nr:unnamed protein product [Linum tenue]CAI0551944.1 unnamed protein product [Linum tenue]
MVDLLGRAGKLTEAEELIANMPVPPDVSTWGALLGACKKHGDNVMGERVGRKLVDLQPEHDGFHVLLSNIYASKEEDKETTLFRHSEKIAIAFGLLTIDAPTPIRIMKNLRICNDCHMAAKLISRAYDREIVVRDRHRFHHFKQGSCSCLDYW